MNFPYVDLGARFPSGVTLPKDCLLLYACSRGLSYRLILQGEAVDLSAPSMLIEMSLDGDTLDEVVHALADALNAEKTLLPRSKTVVLTVSTKLRYLEQRMVETLSRLDFADSVTALSRKELFYRAERALSVDVPTQLLFCGERETSLFLEGREVMLPKSRTGGNGFEDYVLSFVVNAFESEAHYNAQIPRLYALFRAYSYFSREDLREDPLRIYPIGWGKPAALPDMPSDGDILPIPYRLLSAEERIKVDRRFFALCTTPRRGQKRGKAITIAKAATVYERMIAPMRNEALSSILLTGAYADFPLLSDFLSSLPQKPEVAFVDEATLVFFGMILAVEDRISHTSLYLVDATGEEVLLFGEDSPAEERRVSFAATLRSKIASSDWSRERPYFPYRLCRRFVRIDGQNYTVEDEDTCGDLKDFCYTCDENSDYVLRFGGEPITDAEGIAAAYETVHLGITATPTGITCHVLFGETEAV